jgi:4-amino-4-deoxy-L-arabinose transferase-like glycosyltransferase
MTSLGSAPVDAFGPYLAADVARVVLAVGGILFTMLCCKVALLRYRNAVPPDPATVLGWLSSAVWALTATMLMAQRIGTRPQWAVIAGFSVALVLGSVSMVMRLHWPSSPFGKARLRMLHEQRAARRHAATPRAKVSA